MPRVFPGGRPLSVPKPGVPPSPPTLPPQRVKNAGTQVRGFWEFAFLGFFQIQSHPHSPGKFMGGIGPPRIRAFCERGVGTLNEWLREPITNWFQLRPYISRRRGLKKVYKPPDLLQKKWEKKVCLLLGALGLPGSLCGLHFYLREGN